LIDGILSHSGFGGARVEELKTETFSTEETKKSNFGAININQKVIENKIFNIDDDDDDVYKSFKKVHKGKKYKISDNGDITYFDNKL
jgi:hypothetical protein